MSVAAAGSPYPTGDPVSDPRLLQSRRTQVATALDAVAPSSGADSRHAVVLGEQRSGRSSVLREVARCAAAERDRLVVSIRCVSDADCNWQDLTRRVLTGITEALAGASAAPSKPWYMAWRDRVYLRDIRPSTERDLLSSALVLANDPSAPIDHAVLERDLAALLGLAHEAGLSGFVVCIDDASSLTEDVPLIEDVLTIFDTVGGYSLLMAGFPVTAEHFMQAASPCLARVVPIWLRPFGGLHQIFTSLCAPLAAPEEQWIDVKDTAFLRDVLRLTGGNPYELMLVGHHLWMTCQRGEQEGYALTPRVLDRVIPDLALLASGGDALLDGAEAIDRLAEEHVRQAVELVAMSRLTVRQIAIARILKIESRDADRVDRAILTADIADESERVLIALEELQEAGVIQLHADREHFNVVGGHPASVLLKYKARARIGAEASSQPFELDFLLAVGRALARDATLRTMEAVEGSASLGFAAIMSYDGGAGYLSPRPAVRSLGSSDGIARLVQAEVDLIPRTRDSLDRIVQLLTEENPVVALIYTAVTYGRDQLEYTELWELPAGVRQEDLAQAWSVVSEEWQPVVAAADLAWNGSEFAVVSGETARRSLIVLQRYAATLAVHNLFDRWRKDCDPDDLARAQRIADEAVDTMRATGLSEAELGGELSGMLSRAGFLKSFDDDLLDEARTALEDAVRTGEADTWATRWNLANIALRTGAQDIALEHLGHVADAVPEGSSPKGTVLFYVPNRAPSDSLISVDGVECLNALLELQGAVVVGNGPVGPDLAEVVSRCRASNAPSQSKPPNGLRNRS